MCNCFLIFPLLRAGSPSDSPDSVLKFKLCPPLNFFPSSSSSDRSDRSSFNKSGRGEDQDQTKQLLSPSSPTPCYTLFESHFGGSPSPTSVIESISRSPDGRFIIKPSLEDSTITHINQNLRKEFPQSPARACVEDSNNASSKESSSVSSEKNGQRETLPVTPAIQERPSHSPGRVRAMARNFSRHGCFYSDDEQGCSEALLERASFYSDCSEKKKYRSLSHREDVFPSLTRRARGLERERLLHQTSYQPINGDSQLTEPSTVTSQLDGERERDNLSRCLRLVREREQIERELEHYTSNRRTPVYETEQKRAKSVSPLRKWTCVESEDPIWKPQDIHLRQKARPGSLAQRVSDYRRGCYFGNTSSPMERLLPSSSYIQWDISPVTSPTSLVPAQSLSEGNTPRCLYPHTCQQDSVDADISCSPATQNTSLSLLFSTRTSLSPFKADQSMTRCPERPSEDHQELPSKTVVEENWRQEKKMPSNVSACRSSSTAPSSPRPSELHHVVIERDGDTSITRADDVRTEHKVSLSHSPSDCSTLPYDQQKVASKRNEMVRDEPSSLLPYNDQEREAIRARSRESDKCVFSDSPSRISPLTVFENEAESDKSNFSRMSESIKDPPVTMSPVQTSAILEYLSLPGFIEMSVDDPVDETEPSESIEPSVQPDTETLLGREPDVVPKTWEHDQDQSKIVGSHHIGVGYERSTQITHSKPASVFKSEPTSNKEREQSSQPLLSQQRFGFKSQDCSKRNPAQTLINTAKSVAAIVSSPKKRLDCRSEQPQRPQGERTNKIASRISQAPVPLMKKSLSVGPCRNFSGVVPQRPFLKKSISLGFPRWEHHENPRTYISETCYRDELPHPDVRVKSYSLGHTPAPYYPMSGSMWRGPLPLHPRCMESSFPSRPGPDPRRQAAVFPGVSRWPLSYQDRLRSIQHKYVPHLPPRPFGPPGPVARGGYLHPSEPRRVLQRPFLPRGYSWPSPYRGALPLPKQDLPREFDRGVSSVRVCPETDGRMGDGGRASYASQSSGRGSVGPYGHLRQSLSITPTLLSSPENTEESERLKTDSGMPEQRSKR